MLDQGIMLADMRFAVGGLAMLLVTAASLVFWLWMLVDCARRVSRGDTSQIGWLLVILLASALGAGAYFLYGRKKNNY